MSGIFGDIVTKNRLRESMMTFIEGKKAVGINWIVGIIKDEKYGNVTKAMRKECIDFIRKEFQSNSRFQKLESRCIEERLI